VPAGEILTNVLHVVGEARQRTLGPFSPSFNIHNILLDGLEKVIMVHENVIMVHKKVIMVHKNISAVHTEM
jgi:hypothetical protein